MAPFVGKLRSHHRAVPMISSAWLIWSVPPVASAILCVPVLFRQAWAVSMRHKEHCFGLKQHSDRLDCMVMRVMSLELRATANWWLGDVLMVNARGSRSCYATAT